MLLDQKRDLYREVRRKTNVVLVEVVQAIRLLRSRPVNKRWTDRGSVVWRRDKRSGHLGAAASIDS